MSNWIHIDQSKRGRIQAIRRENERLIQMLIELGAIRDNMFWPDTYVIYTESGAKDVMKSDLFPCLRPVSECSCKEHKGTTFG